MAYRTTEGKTSTLNIRAADGSGERKQVGPREEGVITVEDWSPDARYFGITLSKFTGANNWHDSLQVRSANGDSKPVLEIEEAEFGKFSPDGSLDSLFRRQYRRDLRYFFSWAGTAHRGFVKGGI